MKKIRYILLAVLLISFCSLSGPAIAQGKSREQRERELRIAEEIDLQKKAFAEQKKAQEEIEKAQDITEREIDKRLKEAEGQIEASSKLKDLVKVYRGDRPFFNGEPFVFTPGMEGFNWYSHNSDNERTTWDFSKSIKESSFSRDYTFDVDKLRTVVMAVNGECRDGEISIKIIMPNGKVYSDIVIDEFGNLNWRKSFRVSDEENADKAGAWIFRIDASKATGFFKISLQTY